MIKKTYATGIFLVFIAACSSSSQKNPFDQDTWEQQQTDTQGEVKQPPVVTIQAPANSAVVEGIIKCKVKVTDPEGGKIKSVHVGLFDLKTKKPTTVVAAAAAGGGVFTADLDTAKAGKKQLKDGNFAFVAMAETGDGRKGSAAVGIKVDNYPPLIALGQPRPNGNFMGNLKMVFRVTDQGGTGVKYVKLLMGGNVLNSIESTDQKPIKDMQTIVFQHSSKDWTPGRLTFTLEAADNKNHKTQKTFEVNYVEQPIFLTGKFVAQGDMGVSKMCKSSGPGGDRIVTIGKGGLIYWVWSDRLQTLVPNTLADNKATDLLCKDVNNDGYGDIITVENNGKTTLATTYLGTKEGGYVYHSKLEIKYPLQGFALGDLSGDGAPELVGISASSSTGLVLAQNDGSGRFGSVKGYVGVTGAYRVTVAELTGDGINDVLVSKRNGNMVTLFPGNGDGTVAIGMNSTLDLKNIDYLAAGKVSPGDNKEDRAIAVDSAAAKVYFVEKGLVNYSLVTTDHLSTALGPQMVTFGDINQDNLVDIAAICTQSNLVAIYFGLSSGKFRAVHWYAAGGGDPTQLLMADVNRDGYKDIVVLNERSSKFTILMFNKAVYTPGDVTTASFSAPQQIYLKGAVKDMGVGHFTSNTDLDVAVLSTISEDEQGSNTKDTLLIYKGNNGVFQQEPVAAERFAENRNGFKVADLDQDGRDDFVVTGQSQDPTHSLDLVFSRKTGFTSSTTQGYIDPLLVGVGDMASASGGSLDKYPDIAVVSSKEDTDGEGNTQKVLMLSILINQGDGTFQQSVGASYPLEKDRPPSDVLLAKLSDNRFPDIFLSTKSDVIYFPTSGLGGHYNETDKKRLAMGNGLASLYLGYLGGPDDSMPDLLALAVTDKNIAISYDLGSSQLFNPPVPLSYTGGGNPVKMVVKDMNLDKFPDIIVLDQGASVVNIFMNLGSNQFSKPYSFSVGAGPIAMAVKDVNGDGCNDILTLDKKGLTVTILMNLLCEEKSEGK